MSSKSPLKGAPRRVAGQSADEQLDSVLTDRVLEPILLTCLAWGLAGSEWLRYVNPYKPMPVPFTIVAVLIMVYAVVRILRARPEIRNLRLGRDGERVVGEVLESLRAGGCKVFHDLIGPTFNVDHVMIGRQGLFVIETKTISKPIGRSPIVRYDGTQVLVDGHRPDRDPIRQVSLLADWVAKQIKESCGKVCPIRPVVLYPGWFIEVSGRSEVWVLNPKAFPKYVGNEPEVLSDDDVKVISLQLSRHSRESNRRDS